MKRKSSVFLFLCVCVILAVLLLAKITSIFVSAIIFAAALILFGIFSRGFRK